MALDSKLVQNIDLRVSDAGQLTKPLEAFGREINRAIKDLSKLSDTMTAGNHKSEDGLRRQVQLLQRLIGEASTLQNVLNASSNKKQNNLFGVIDENSIGKRARSASLLRRELRDAKTAGDALDVRLNQLNQRFYKLAQAGRELTKTDMAKAFSTEEAIRQIRKLEREISKLDARSTALGGLSSQGKDIRGRLQIAQDNLLVGVRATRFDARKLGPEIAQVELLVGQYRKLAAAEQRAALEADKTYQSLRRSLLQHVNQNEAMLRGTLQRQSSRYSFTNDQARGTDMRALGTQIDRNINRLQILQSLMSRALAPGSVKTPQALERLQRVWEGVSAKTAEALALRRAYDNLPEQRGKKITEFLFGDGGVALAGRIAGATLIIQGLSAIQNALGGAVRTTIEFEDALAKLQAISGSTDQQMVRLGGSIRELARTSRFSTVEITQSATQIAQAGFAAAETSQILKDALALATASGSTPSQSVENLTSALGAFQLQASESTRVVDIMVQGLNRSKLSMEQMQAAIQYAGATAKENGVRFEELTAIASSLANAGIRSGSTIGTGMRQLLVDLKTPTEKFKKEIEAVGLSMADIDVKSKGLVNVIKDLTNAGFSAEQAYASFEVRAAASFLALRGQLDQFDELQLAILQTGAAAEAQAISMGTLAAKWQELKNNLAEFAQEGLGEDVLVLLKAITDGFTAFFTKVNEGNKVLEEYNINIGASIPVFANLQNAIDGLNRMLYEQQTIQTALITATNDARDSLASQRQTLTSVDEAIQDLITRGDTLNKNQTALQAETFTLTERFEGLASHLGGAVRGYNDLLDAMMRYRKGVQEAVGEDARELALVANSRIKIIGRSLQENGNEWSDVDPDKFENSVARRAAKFFAASGSQDLTTFSAENLTSHRNIIKARLNDLVAAAQKDDELARNKNVKELIGLLKERLRLIDELSGVNQELVSATNQYRLSQARTAPLAQKRDERLLDFQQDAQETRLQFQADPDKAAEAMRALIARGNSQIAAWGRQIAALKDTPERQNFIDQKQALEAVVLGLERAVSKEGEDTKQKPGAVLNGREVRDLIVGNYKKATVTSYLPRSLKKQQELYNAYKAGKGPLAAKPGQSNHGKDRAVDVLPIPGVTFDELLAFLESKGLNILPDSQIEKSPNGKVHWHIAWGAKSSQFSSRLKAAEEKSARELQQLLEAEASSRTGASRSRISGLINEAKGGSRPAGVLNTELQAAFEEYRSRTLSEFDTKNPIEGLSEAGVKQRDLARRAEADKVTEDIANWHAQFWRATSDAVAKTLDAALEAAELAFQKTEIDAERGVLSVTSRGQALGNNLNRSRYGAGAAYRQKQSEFSARLAADKQLRSGLSERALSEGIAFEQYNQEISGLTPGSEAYDQAVKKRDDAEQKLNETLRQREALQASINARTQEGVDGMGTLTDRLHDAVAAWADNSGAMDTWGTMLENSISPALELFATQLAQMFENLATGSRTFAQALGDMAKAFARFVLQIITKALALMAVKAILKAFGLELQDSPGGVIIGKKPKGSFNGGLVEGKFGGGYIDRGFKTHDSALYNLARGEYVVRNQSVDELGLPFMDAINKHGRKGLERVAGGGGFFNMQMPRQETNVYVVAEKDLPPLGPNDVLTVIHRDIAQNGPTKRLIKQVAQGG